MINPRTHSAEVGCRKKNPHDMFMLITMHLLTSDLDAFGTFRHMGSQARVGRTW